MPDFGTVFLMLKYNDITQKHLYPQTLKKNILSSISSNKSLQLALIIGSKQ